MTGLHCPISPSTTYEFDYWLVVNSSDGNGVRLSPSSDSNISTVGTGIMLGGDTSVTTQTSAFSDLTQGPSNQALLGRGGPGTDAFVRVSMKYKMANNATYMGLSLMKQTSGTATLRAGSKIYYRLSA